jgi:hypothetical protein
MDTDKKFRIFDFGLGIGEKFLPPTTPKTPIRNCGFGISDVGYWIGDYHEF